MSEENSANVEFNQDLFMLESFMKISGSIKAELVPANDLYLDKKGFSWKLDHYSTWSLSFHFEFEHPKFISVGGIDTMRITFSNT